jgi:hypothetical protein
LRLVCNLIRFWIIASFYQYLLWCNFFSHFIILSSASWQNALWCNSMPSWSTTIFAPLFPSLHFLSTNPSTVHKAHLHLISLLNILPWEHLANWRTS